MQIPSIHSEVEGIATPAFFTLMLRAYGIEPDDDPTDNFIDAGNAYYTGYLAAAKRLGISAGIGGNRFGPELSISRQDMYTLLYKTLKLIGQLPERDSGRTLSDFSDSGEIAPYAREAMEYLVRIGALDSSDGRLTPPGRRHACPDGAGAV